MGSPFPFLSLASSPPPAPAVSVERNPTSNVGSVISPSPAACHSSFLSGEPFPFLRVNQVIPASQVKIYPTLGRWLAAHGGRSGFCRWLRDTALTQLGTGWAAMAPDEIWDHLTWDEDMAQQVETVLAPNPEFFDRELESFRPNLMVHSTLLYPTPT